MSGLIDNNPKSIIVKEARSLLKLGSTSPSLRQETLFLLMIPDEIQKKTVNSKLKCYGSSCRVEE
jgi:hypothetical protein